MQWSRRKTAAVLVAAVGLGAAAWYAPLLQRAVVEARYEGLFREGVADVRGGMPWEGAQKLREAARLSPRRPMTYYYLALACSRMQKLDLASEHLGRVLDDPEMRAAVGDPARLVRFYLRRGDISMSKGRYGQAREDFAAALSLEPGRGDVSYYISRAASSLDQWDQAQEAAKKALELGYRTHLSTCQLGVVYANLGRDTDAIKQLRESIRLSPGYTRAYQVLARVLVRIGQREEGNRMYELTKLLARADDEIHRFRDAMLSQTPGDVGYRDSMESGARYCSAFGKHQDLDHFASSLLRLDPGKAEYHLWKAEAESSLSRDRMVVAHLMMALRLNPDLVPALNHLSQIHAISKDPQVRDTVEAVVLARRSRSLGYEGPENLAEALRALGDMEGALRVLGLSPDAGIPYEDFRDSQVARFQEALLAKGVGSLAAPGAD